MVGGVPFSRNSMNTKLGCSPLTGLSTSVLTAL